MSYALISYFCNDNVFATGSLGNGKSQWSRTIAWECSHTKNREREMELWWQLYANECNSINYFFMFKYGCECVCVCNLWTIPMWIALLKELFNFNLIMKFIFVSRKLTKMNSDIHVLNIAGNVSLQICIYISWSLQVIKKHEYLKKIRSHVWNVYKIC